MTVRDVDFLEAYKMCIHLNISQWVEEIEIFLDKCVEYLGKVSTIMEIGSFQGGNLAILNRLMLGTTDDLLISVSLGRGSEAVNVSKVTELVRPSKVVYINANSQSPSTIKMVDETLDDRKIDILFLDGDHSLKGVTADYNNYLEYCNTKSIVGLHDLRGPYGVLALFNKLKSKYRNDSIYCDSTITYDLVEEVTGTAKTGKHWSPRGIGILYKEKA